MAQLSSVIGSILRDIIQAQHEANLYSLALGESYGKDGKVKDFQLPNVAIGDIELELKYGVISASENQEQYNIKYTKFRRFLREMSVETAKVAINSAVSTVLNSDIKCSEEDKLIFCRLQKEADLRKRFGAFLSRNMRKAFDSYLFEAIDTTTGIVKTDVITGRFMDVIRKKFLYDTELNGLYVITGGRNLCEQLDENVEKAVAGIVAKLSEDANFKRQKKFPQLDVAVTAGELEKMPEEAIHLFRFKFSPRNYSITELDEDDVITDDFVL